MVSSANNKTVTDDYPYYIGFLYSMPDRIDRIREMLNEKPTLGIEDFARMQADQKSKHVEKFKPLMIEELSASTNLKAVEKQLLDSLKAWDGNMSINSVSATVFEKYYLNIAKNILSDELGDELYTEFLKNFTLVKNLLQKGWMDASLSWFDDVNTPEKESRNDIFVRSYQQTIEELTKDFGKDITGWQWGTVHQFKLTHPLSKVKALDFVFGLSQESYKIGGSSHTVSPYSYSTSSPFAVVHGASHRHIFSLDDWDASLTVIPTGTSGIPASVHYCDQTKMYVENRYHPDFFDRVRIAKSCKYETVMIPK